MRRASSAVLLSDRLLVAAYPHNPHADLRGPWFASELGVEHWGVIVVSQLCYNFVE